MHTQKIEISARTIIFTVFFLLSLGLLWQIKELIFSLFIAFIIAGALKPAVAYFEKMRLPRPVGAVFIFALFIFIIFNIFSLVIPPLINEVIYLSKTLPVIIKTSLPNYASYFNFDFLTKNLPGLTNQTIDFIKTIFSNVFFVTSTLFFGFYFLLEKHLAKRLLENFFDDHEVNKIELISDRAQARMSSWFWGEVILMIVVGILTYIGLNIIGMKYALALAVLAGLLEVVPTLGPIASSIPAILIGLSHSPILALSNVALYLVVQQLENNLIVPIVMRKVTGLHPVAILIAMVVGGKLAGIMGVFLAVPTTIFIETILIEIQKLPKR